jgi:hypothetical protein
MLKSGLALSLLLIGGVPASAADPATGDNLSALSNEQLMARLNGLYGAKDTSACRDMVPTLDEMIRRKSFDPGYGQFKLRFDLQCAIDERRYADAYPLLLKNEKINGEVVAPIAAVMISLEAKQYDAAVDRFIAAAGKPADSGGLADSFTNMRWLDRKLAAASRHDLALALGRRFSSSAAYRALADREKDHLRETLFRREVEAGDVEAARPLLSSITEPYWFFRLLPDRRYAAFWPDLERRAGPNMSAVFAANIDRAQAEYRADPGSAEKLSDLATALNEAGRYDEVLALTDDFAAPGKLPVLGEFHFWALDARVNALDGLGREAEASALFDAMAAVPFDKSKNGWLVNFVANRSGRLARMGEWSKVLEASERAALVANQYGSPYVRQIIAVDRACALAELDRVDELEPLLVAIEQNRADDPAAAVQAMQCAGREDRAAEIVIEALRDPDLRAGMLRNLQGQEYTTLAGRTGAPDLFLPLKRRPAVAAVFNEVGRDLPPSLVTPAGKRWLEQQPAGTASASN